MVKFEEEQRLIKLSFQFSNFPIKKLLDYMFVKFSILESFWNHDSYSEVADLNSMLRSLKL